MLVGISVPWYAYVSREFKLERKYRNLKLSRSLVFCSAVQSHTPFFLLQSSNSHPTISNVPKHRFRGSMILMTMFRVRHHRLSHTHSLVLDVSRAVSALPFAINSRHPASHNGTPHPLIGRPSISERREQVGPILHADSSASENAS